MLKVRFGMGEHAIFNSDHYFDFQYEDEWFDDPLVQEMIEDVDKSKVIGPMCIQSPVLGMIAPTALSGGVKALILMLKTDEEIWATACGDNCAKWIRKISEMKDLTISLEHFMNFGDNEFTIFDVNKGVECKYFDGYIFRKRKKFPET